MPAVWLPNRYPCLRRPGFCASSSMSSAWLLGSSPFKSRPPSLPSRLEAYSPSLNTHAHTHARQPWQELLEAVDAAVEAEAGAGDVHLHRRHRRLLHLRLRRTSCADSSSSSRCMAPLLQRGSGSPRNSSSFSMAGNRACSRSGGRRWEPLLDRRRALRRGGRDVPRPWLGAVRPRAQPRAGPLPQLRVQRRGHSHRQGVRRNYLPPALQRQEQRRGRVEQHRRRVERRESGMSKLQLEKSLKKIESSISDACKVLDELNLPSISHVNGRAVTVNSRSAVTTAGPPLRVIGRDQDRDNIIAMLYEKENHPQANIISGTGYSVIGIHGIAGSGKTTLAQCVYDHVKKYRQEKMEGHFDIVMWVHVSQQFTLDSIFSEMFEGATQKECPKFSSRNILKESLEEKLRGKRILLVLDDVWYDSRNAGDREKLQNLISPLNVVMEGSRILVTSRTEAALVTLGAVKERRIPISDLDDEVFLEMFMHYALRDAKVSDDDRRKLEMIGEDIAKKLKRSPLAARTVGSLLHDKQTVEFWNIVKDQDLLNSTMGALWWSYQYLDEQVRRCFAYCSIFPRGHRLKRDELVKLWVAEGFIKTSKPEEKMEDVAKNYFDELLSASFLQLGGKNWSRESYNFGCEVDFFTIHDLLCDLAEEVAGRDCFRIEKVCKGEVPQDVRYLFVGAYNREILTEKIFEMQNLRTLIIGFNTEVNSTTRKDFERMFDKLMGLRKLRVLKFHLVGLGLHTFKFPDSIGQMKHLRYFAFSVGAITKLTLPGSFTKLYHMQVVHFGFCTNLAFPSGKDMTNLVNLRCVITMGGLDFPNIGKLTWLQMLLYYTIRKKQGYESHQLQHLNKLQDKLQIHGLENVQTKEEALEVNLPCKEKLTELVLQWDKQSCTPEVQAKVLEGLCPSKYLERLDIRNYDGMKLPSWMMCERNGGPKNLQELKLYGWCQQGPAPDLWAFIHLHSLHLDQCSWNALPDMEHLTSLKKLQISGCENMRLLGTLPKSLEEFTIERCNREFTRSCITTADPNWQKIEHIPKKTFEIGNWPRTVALHLTGADGDGVETIQFLQNIQDITE